MSGPRILEPMGIDVVAEAERQRLLHEDNQRRLLPYWLKAWRVAPLERRIVLGAIQQRLATQHVVDFDRSKAQSLYLWGPSGSGKSVAAAWWLTRVGKRAIETALLGRSWEWDPTCRFLSVFELGRIQKSWQPDDKERMADCVKARALVIDDIGTEGVSVMGGLTELVYERNRFERRTLITGNLEPKSKEFREKYGDRVIRRLTQFGMVRGCVAGGGK
jgi:DNA replication protein DnaC